MASVQMPEPPYGKKWLDEKSGLVSREWTLWIRQLFLRVGGVVAPSNADLADVPADHEARIDALETLTSSQATAINTLKQQVLGLQVGPDL